VLGQFYPLQHRHVEEHERRAGKLVLTTDGITDALRKTRRVLEYIFVKRGDDSVVIAESLIRTALRLTLKSGISDDMTVVIQE
jgi:serine/threonine protein phosphatase PrpC